MVTETADCGLLGERMLPSLRHAIKSLVRPGPPDSARAILPTRAEVFFVLVSIHGREMIEREREKKKEKKKLFRSVIHACERDMCV